MKKLVAKENRVTELLKFGAPKSFIENIGKANELEFIIEKVDRAYEYLPQISNYSILKNLNLIPIFCRDYSFWVFAYNEQTKKIIDFNLENDEIYNDYGNNWDLLLMDIMTQYFDDEIEKGLDVEKFKSVAEKIGFHKASELYKLRNLPIEEYNIKFGDEKKWRTELAEKLKIL